MGRPRAPRRRPTWLWLACLLPAVSWAGCPWDRDSLAAERAELPGIYEAIMGAYPRHTREYYQYRIERIEAAGGERTASLYDDLAVAYGAIGHLGRAIELLREKAERYPDEYTTWANLGALLARQERWREASEALERGLAMGPEQRFRIDRYQLLATRYFERGARNEALLVRETMLGFDFESKLGPFFRVNAPRAGDERERELARRHVLNRLRLDADVFDGLVGLIVSAREEVAEYYYVLAELLAASGERRLAWHGYQRAYDLEHPRSVDLPLYQSQVAGGLSPDERRDLRPARHWRLRRRILAWVDAYQAYERKLIADGGDPEDPAAYEPFYREHPRP